METEPIHPDQNEDEGSVMEEILDTVEDGRRMVKFVRPLLTSVIVVLGILALILIFKLGLLIWPVWIIEYRRQLLGAVLLALICLFLTRPFLIEATVNTKPLITPEEGDGDWSD